MNSNAYILDWTMDDYEQLQNKLENSGFAFAKEKDSKNIRISVPFAQVNEFASLCQTHINAPHNYVDIQYPDRKMTVIVFQKEVFRISAEGENEKVKEWAISIGLPPEQADWAVSF